MKGRLFPVVVVIVMLVVALLVGAGVYASRAKNGALVPTDLQQAKIDRAWAEAETAQVTLSVAQNNFNTKFGALLEQVSETKKANGWGDDVVYCVLPQAPCTPQTMKTWIRVPKPAAQSAPVKK